MQSNAMAAGQKGSWISFVTLTVLYSAVQGILAIPVLYGFAALVFSSAVYQPFMPSIAKMFMFSSFVHATAVTALSSLPFAIGQVQDAGLLFFAKMATDIAVRMNGAAPEAIISTAFVAIGLSTAFVGLCLICVGKLKLANLVYYIPMPVFGGYLAFIGLFCIEAGLSLTSGQGINGVDTWSLLVASDRIVLLVLTAMLTGACLCWVARNLDTMILPASICVIPVIFYLALFLSGTSMEDARQYGWLGPERPSSGWEGAVMLFDFSKVDWSVMPRQLPTLLTMVIVVTFGSTMDIAAVEMGTGAPLNSDDQLVTIGVSNIIAGASGGFTGSYIFTQTLLGYKSKFHSRSVGYGLAGLQLGIFLCSFEPLSSIPLFFFASTIIFIGIDLMIEWLWEVRIKLSLGEYFVLLVTFVAIVAIGMDMGFVIGMIAAVINFVYDYAVSARNNSSQYVVNITSRMRSGHLRRPEHERRLKQHFGTIRTLELHGSIFFGSAAGVFSDIVDACKMSMKMSLGTSYGSIANLSSPSTEGGYRRSNSEVTPLMRKKTEDGNAMQDIEAASVGASSNVSEEKENTLRFLVLDCRNLKGVDATAAKRCFCELHQFAKRKGFSIVFAGCTENVLNIINSHGALSLPWTRHIENIYDALDYCETTLLTEMVIDNDKTGNKEHHEFTPMRHRALSLRQSQRFTVTKVLQIFFELTDQQAQQLDQYSDYYEEYELQADTLLFALMDDPDCFYLVLGGEIQTYLIDHNSASNQGTVLHPGACVGYADYMLHQPRTFFAKAAVSPTVVACFTRRNLEKLIELRSLFAMYMLQLVCKQSALELQNVHI